MTRTAWAWWLWWRAGVLVGVIGATLAARGDVAIAEPTLLRQAVGTLLWVDAQTRTVTLQQSVPVQGRADFIVSPDTLIMEGVRQYRLEELRFGDTVAIEYYAAAGTPNVARTILVHAATSKATSPAAAPWLHEAGHA